jgi:hypothetical protein
VILSSNIIKTPLEKEQRKKKGRERRAPRVSSNKVELIFWDEENTSTSKILFDVIPFSPPPSYHFKNPFQNYWESFLNSFWTIL